MKRLKLVFKGDVNSDFLNEKYIFCIVLTQQKSLLISGVCIFHVLSVNIIKTGLKIMHVCIQLQVWTNV